jgi:hypothetical protein
LPKARAVDAAVENDIRFVGELRFAFGDRVVSSSILRPGKGREAEREE